MTNIELLIFLLAIIIDAICLYRLLKWGWAQEVQLRNGLIILISGAIIYVTFGLRWWGWFTVGGQDPYGDPGQMQLGMIIVAVCPGLLVTSIWTYIEDKIIFYKHEKKRKK